MMISELLALRDVSHDAFKGAVIPFLPELLIYRDDGRLIWRERPLDWFSNNHACTAWNRRYSGGLALDYINNYGYRVGKLLGFHFVAHRVVWALHNQEWLELCDHINGVRSDNRIENLRIASRSQNNQNQKLRSDNQSGLKGVCWHKKRSKWRAYISIKGNQRHLGLFESVDEAHAAYCAASKSLFGAFARTE